MGGDFEQRLRDRGIELPQAPPAAANYVPFRITDNQVYCAGQLPSWAGEIRYKGRASAMASRSRKDRRRPDSAD